MLHGFASPNGAVRRPTVARGPTSWRVRSALVWVHAAWPREALRCTTLLEQALAATGAPARLTRVGCVGMCHQTPLVEMVQHDGRSNLYAKVQPGHARDIVLRHFQPQGISRRVVHAVARLLDRWHTDEEDAAGRGLSIDVREAPVCAFLGPQQRLATEHCSHVDPLDIDAYQRLGGFAGLRRCLTELDGQQIVAEIRASGLRGRGARGFPRTLNGRRCGPPATGRPMSSAMVTRGTRAPLWIGCCWSRSPTGSSKGWRLPLAPSGRTRGCSTSAPSTRWRCGGSTRRSQQCRQRGFLGDAVMGSGFRLNLSVKEGAGAFVCGEETALINSLEGNRGTPRIRPPYPAESGFRGKPTLINNVETFALVPWILRHGAAEFAKLGTETSKGTKVFALAGKVQRGGLIEVPMGVTLREIVEQIGGGVMPGRQFKAVQVGGPSGGCVPAELADTPVDYEALSRVGAIMGSGGLVVLDDTDCMVDMARYFLRFTQDQSCGKCTFCRVGTKRMLEIMDRICTGHGRAGDLAQLEQLSRQVGAASLCGLGKTAPNPVLSTLKYFRSEYEAHLEGRCPAGRCMELISYRVNQRCVGCTLCAQHCPVDAIPWTPYQRHRIELDKCTRCDTCRAVCPAGAVDIV